MNNIFYDIAYISCEDRKIYQAHLDWILNTFYLPII